MCCSRSRTVHSTPGQRKKTDRNCVLDTRANFFSFISWNWVNSPRIGRSAYSAQSDHLFRSIPITCSASFRSPVPILSDHRIVIFSGRLRVAGDTGMSIMILIV
jgi:hypothetical protein